MPRIVGIKVSDMELNEYNKHYNEFDSIYCNKNMNLFRYILLSQFIKQQDTIYYTHKNHFVCN